MAKNCEIWRAVIGYKGFYEVSNKGRVRRIKAEQGTYVGRILTPQPHGGGYQTVFLACNKIKKIVLVHRLVCMAFRGKPPTPKHQVNHKDGNKANNNDWNLEWVTPRENASHSHNELRNVTGKFYSGIVGPYHPRSKKYIMTSPEGVEYKIIGLSYFSRLHGLNNSNWGRVIKGTLKHNQGWKCRKVEEL